MHVAAMLQFVVVFAKVLSLLHAFARNSSAAYTWVVRRNYAACVQFNCRAECCIFVQLCHTVFSVGTAVAL
jgi:hypothetical protein